MSYSVRKSPIVGRLSHKSETYFKARVARANRRKVRRALKQALAQVVDFDALTLPLPRQLSNRGRGTKHGKSYIGGDDDCRHLLRK